MPSGRTSKFPLSGWQELPLPRAERGLTAAGRADFGNAIEVIRISDRSLLSIFAKNLELCNFRLCNTIGPMRTSNEVRFGIAFEGIADIKLRPIRSVPNCGGLIAILRTQPPSPSLS
jgi:hypothetical protein